MRVSWDDQNPNVIVTGNGLVFDPEILAHLKEEEFGVTYLPYTDNPKDYSHQLQGLEDSLEFGDRYAIVGTLRIISLFYGTNKSFIQPPCYELVTD